MFSYYFSRAKMLASELHVRVLLVRARLALSLAQAAIIREQIPMRDSSNACVPALLSSKPDVISCPPPCPLPMDIFLFG